MFGQPAASSLRVLYTSHSASPSKPRGRTPARPSRRVFGDGLCRPPLEVDWPRLATAVVVRALSGSESHSSRRQRPGSPKVEHLDLRLLMSSFDVTIAGGDVNVNPPQGTLRWAKQSADANPGTSVYIEPGVNPVLKGPLFLLTNGPTIYANGATIYAAPDQPVAIVGTALVTFYNATFVTTGGSPAITTTGEIDLESCVLDGGGVVSNLNVPGTVTVNNTTFENIPANAGPAAVFNETAGDDVEFTNNTITNCSDRQLAYAGPANAVLDFAGNNITGNEVTATGAAITISGTVNALEDAIVNNSYPGPIMGLLVNAGETDDFTTVYINGNNSGSTAAPIIGAIMVQDNGGIFFIQNTTAAFNNVVGNSLFSIQGELATVAFANVGIAANTCGGIFSAIPIAVNNAVFNYNFGYGIDAVLTNNTLASSGYIDVGVLVGSSYPPNSSAINAEIDGMDDGLTLQLSPSSGVANLPPAPGSGQEYLGYNTSFA